MTRLILPIALVLALLPAAAFGFDGSQPDSVALAFVPFEPDREQDAAISFLLEDYVKAHLQRQIRHTVHLGDELQPALTGGVAPCLADTDCVMLLGAQFDASLVVQATVLRAGSELDLRTRWYTTGNGLQVGEEHVRFEPGDERVMVESLAAAFEKYFDTSLRVDRENLAGEGGVLDAGSDQRERVDDFGRRQEKRHSSRRQDFDAEWDDVERYDRDPGDLRAVVGEDEDLAPARGRARRQNDRAPAGGRDYREEGRAPERGRAYREEDRTPDRGRAYREEDRTPDRGRGYREEDRAPDLVEQDDEVVEDEDLVEDDADLVEEPPPRSPRRRPTAAEEDEDLIDLDADDDRGRSVATYDDAQRLGYSRREYERYARSGKTFDEYQASRWTLGKRFSLKVGGVYGLGYLTRRYASTIFIRVGGVKTDEYAWERLGFTAATGGFSLGVAFAPADVFGVEADVSVIAAQQDLRREYDSHDQGSNVGQVTPESQPTAHVGIDVTARAYIFPKRRVKLSPGLGATFLIMEGYSFGTVAAGQLEYSERPTALVIGVTPVLGVRIAANPFVHIFIDLSGTVYVSQGDAYYEDHMLFGTVEPYLTADKQQVPLPVIPLMGRLAAGVQLLF